MNFTEHRKFPQERKFVRRIKQNVLLFQNKCVLLCEKQNIRIELTAVCQRWCITNTSFVDQLISEKINFLFICQKTKM